MEKSKSLRIAFIFIIFVINLTGGLIPLYWKKFSANPKALSVMNSFASGVFLSMALVHIQPESVEGYIAIRKAGCPGYEEEEEPVATRRLYMENRDLAGEEASMGE